MKEFGSNAPRLGQSNDLAKISSGPPNEFTKQASSMH